MSIFYLATLLELPLDCEFEMYDSPMDLNARYLDARKELQDEVY
jgi:hypothetical protein